MIVRLWDRIELHATLAHQVQIWHIHGPTHVGDFIHLFMSCVLRGGLEICTHDSLYYAFTSLNVCLWEPCNTCFVSNVLYLSVYNRQTRHIEIGAPTLAHNEGDKGEMIEWKAPT